nr:uncharacterized protein LOC128704905 [Cherax quadricarinatus]
MANVTIAASVFTLTAISSDRYIAIVRPLKPRMSKGEALQVILIIWISSMILAIPCLLFSTTVSIRYKNDEIRRGCFLAWPDGDTSTSYMEYVYNTVFFSSTYILPMCVMLVSYSLIGCELWGSRSIGEPTDRQATSIKSKKRVVRMLMVIVTIFMLCWLPQQGFFLYQYHNRHVLDTENIQHIYLGFYWLAMANAMVNPMIYYWMNTRFRTYFREVVLQCCPGRWRCWNHFCLSRKNRFLDSPQLQSRQDSAEHTSRTRSDGRVNTNVVPRSTAGHHDNLFTYSKKSFRCSHKGPVRDEQSDQTVEYPKHPFTSRPKYRTRETCSLVPVRYKDLSQGYRVPGGDEDLPQGYTKPGVDKELPQGYLVPGGNKELPQGYTDSGENKDLPQVQYLSHPSTISINIHQTSTINPHMNGVNRIISQPATEESTDEVIREHGRTKEKQIDVDSPVQPVSRLPASSMKSKPCMAYILHPVACRNEPASPRLCSQLIHSSTNNTIAKIDKLEENSVERDRKLAVSNFATDEDATIVDPSRRVTKQRFGDTDVAVNKLETKQAERVKLHTVQQAIADTINSALQDFNTSHHCDLHVTEGALDTHISLNASKEIML